MMTASTASHRVGVTLAPPSSQVRQNWYLVTIDDAGVKIGCTAIFPETDRDIVDGRMRLDGQAVFVTVDGSGGDEGYIADLNNPGAEPVPGVPSLVMDPDWRVYANRAGA